MKSGKKKVVKVFLAPGGFQCDFETEVYHGRSCHFILVLMKS